MSLEKQLGQREGKRKGCRRRKEKWIDLSSSEEGR